MSKVNEIVLVNKDGGSVIYEWKPINEYEGSWNEKALSHSFVSDVLRKIMGKVLTIIDASVLDKQQNKAMKDLLRAAISEEMEFSADMAYDQDEISKSAEIA